MSQKRSLSFFSKKKSQIFKPDKVHSDFATKIIDKEIELEKTWDVKVIHELMSLYRRVIEEYEQNNNPKFYDFQDRMHKMLIKPQVIAALQKVNCPNKQVESPTIPEPVQGRIKNSLICQPEVISNKSMLRPPKSPNHMADRKAQAELTRKYLSKELSKTLSRPKNSRKVNVIIDRQTSNSRETAHRAVQDFKSQESALGRRIASRRMSQAAKSMTFNSFNSSDLSRVLACDLSDMSEENNTSTKSSFFVDEQQAENYEKFERRLEEIMEKNYSEKAMRVAEVKFKYEGQIAELSGSGEIIEMLVRQMRVNMDEEVEKINEEFDKMRKEEIRRLKEDM